jgi:eukaryotic-like serine/threonine-protein kinase
VNQRSTSSSQYPVVDQLGLSDRQDWLGELARWYEADWKLALLGEKQPQSDLFVQVLDESRRSEAISVLSSIGEYYQRQLSTLNNFGANEATIVHHSVADSEGSSPNDVVTRFGSDVQPTMLPRSDSFGSDVTIDSQGYVQAKKSASVLDQPTTVFGEPSAKSGYEATMDFSVDKYVDQEATMAFRADPTVKEHEADDDARDESMDFSVGVKKGSSKKSKEKLPKIPGYKVKSVLGRGGMGIVYLAEQQGIKRDVALKMVLAGGMASREVLERFQAEARAVGRFQHENIVRIFDIGDFEGLPYFSLEYIDGPSLSAKIDGKPMDPKESAQILEPLARGLAFAHASGVTHRDLKPGNILLTNDGVPKLSDFGLAKQEEGGYDLSRTGDVVGTPSYMAPEQALGESTVGPLSDVYALGAVLYCMLTGRPPFLANKPTDTLIQLLHEEPIEPMKLIPSLDKDLDTICLKCLQKEPQKRYESAAAFADDLKRYLAGEPIAARPISRFERVVRYSKRKPRQAALIATAAGLAGILAIGGPLAAGAINEKKKEAVAAKQDAQNQAVIAQNNEKKAIENEKKAIENEKKAIENENQAVANGHVAMEQQKNAIDALKSLVFQVQREMSDDPRLVELRQKLLDVAKDGLERMDRDGIDANASNIIQAGIERRLGDVNLELGRVDRATTNYETCLKLLQSLAAQGKLNGIRHNFSTAYDVLGDAYRAGGDLRKSAEYFEKSLEERRTWLTEVTGTDKENVEQNVAASLGKLGFVEQELGLLDKAAVHFGESAKIRDAYLKANPLNGEAQLESIGARWALSGVTFQRDTNSDAIDSLQSVLHDLNEMAKINEFDLGVQQNRVIAANDIATMLIYRQQYAEAIEKLDLAKSILDAIASDMTNSLKYLDLQADTLYSRGICEQALGKDDEAKTSFEQSLALRESLLQIDSSNQASKLPVVLTAARLNRLDRAMEIVGTIDLAALDSGMKYHLACAHAQILASLERGTESTGTNADNIREVAMKQLGEAIQAGFSRESDLKFDPDLAPLRSVPNFVSLISKK